MNQQQARNLRNLRSALLHLPDTDANDFDIRSCATCAWGFAREMRIIPGFDDFNDSPAVFGVSDEPDGTDEFYSEDDYLFQNSSFSPWTYDTPSGRAGIEEFADRVENVLQYYASLRT